MCDRLLYRFRYMLIIIGIIGVCIILYIVTEWFDALNALLDYSLNWLRPVIGVIIGASGGAGIGYWYAKKWGIEDYNLGVQLLDVKDINNINNDKALLQFENAIKKNPYLWQAYFSAAIIYCVCKKNYDKALEYIKTVIKLKPKFGFSYLLLGTFLNLKEIEEIKQGVEIQHQSDLYNEAIEAYKKALKLRLSKEEKLQAHALLSELYLQLGLIDEGEKELNEVLKIDPHNKTAYDYLDELVKGGFIVEKRRWRLFS